MAADNTPIKGGLSTDPRAINFYGAQDADITEYQKSLDDSIKALQQRYAQPNWFNVAAGFFKPQLGGFAASLGSASEALGQNVERERESQMPIAQMRSQLAMSKIAMGQNKQASDLIKAHEAAGSPLHDLPGLVPKLKALGSPLAESAQSQMDQIRKSQDLAVQASQASIAQRNAAKELIDRDELNFVITPLEASNRRAALPPILPMPPDPFAPPARVEKGAPAPALAKESAAAAPPPAAAVETGALPPVAAAAKTPDAAAADAAAEKAKLTVLPNGARVGPDGLALFQAGIPIISQFRTKEDQDKLRKDGGYQDEKGNWFTKAGRPIAEDSRHFTGDAIDLDSNAKLTDEQKKLLAAQGFKQGSGKEANHWSRTPTATAAAAAPAAAVVAPKEKITEQTVFPALHPRPTESDLIAKRPDERALIIKSAQEKADADELRAKGLLQQWVGYGNPAIYNPYKGELNQSISMIEANRKIADRVFNAMGQGDLQAQLLKAANAGLTFNGGVWSGSINLPADDWIRAGLLKEDATFANKLATNFLHINAYKSQLQNIGTGNPPVAEFNALQNRGANLGQTYDAALTTLKKDRINAYWGNKLYNTIVSEKDKAAKNEMAPTAATLKHSKEYDAIQKQWAEDLKSIK